MKAQLVRWRAPGKAGQGPGGDHRITGEQRSPPAVWRLGSAELELAQGQVERVARAGDGEVEEQCVEQAMVERGDRVAAGDRSAAAHREAGTRAEGDGERRGLAAVADGEADTRDR